MHRPGGCDASRVEFDLAEGAFVVGNVLLQDGGQRLCLLRAEINALEVSYLHLILRLLLHGPEHQKEVPNVDPHLHAVGVGLTIISSTDDVEVRLRGNNHNGDSVTGTRAERNVASSWLYL